MIIPKSYQTSPAEPALIVADSHLPLDDRPGAEESMEDFRRLIRAHSDSVSLLVLLGDIFDFWYEWNHVVPKRATKLLYDLHDIVRRGVEVHFFAGNHDFRVTGFLEREIGLTVHMDEWLAEIDGRKVYFHHGDGLAKSDHRYRAMKRIFRGSVAQWLFGNLLHPDLAMEIGRFASSLGERDRGGKPYPGTAIEEYHDRARAILRRGFDLVILGHVHQPELIEFPEGWYHNPGAFSKQRCYSVIAGGLPEGRKWK